MLICEKCRLKRSWFQIKVSKLFLSFLSLAAALTVNSPVFAADKPKETAENSGAPDVSYPLDEFLDQCLAQPNHGATTSQVECTKQAAQLWDQQMNQDYQRLSHSLCPKAQMLLQDAQRCWLRYRDADQALIDAVYEMTSGTMYAPMQAYSRLRLVRERSLVLKSYLSVLTNSKARKDLPRAGKVREDVENSGSPEVNYPLDETLDHYVDQHLAPSEQASWVEELVGKWDEAMNTAYQKLMVLLPAKAPLIEAQRVWIVFRDAEYPLIDSIYEKLPLEEYRALHAYARLRLTRERTLLLKKYLALTSVSLSSGQ
ncbi:MAG: DUF1311 domain-containing protein [Verrucomicrobia bacterium]|nr:DUF1311 domain-containing protein [Verrucomicrobiota bacterium]